MNSQSGGMQGKRLAYLSDVSGYTCRPVGRTASKISAGDGHSYIYFVRQAADGPIKIGFTKYPRRRIAELQLASPHPLEVVGLLRRSQRDEAFVHEHFADQRLRGEWFEPSDDLLAVARGEAWPEVRVKTECSSTVDPNDVEMSMNDWNRRADIERYREAGADDYAIASMLGWPIKRVQREIVSMTKLGYFQGVELRPRCA